MMQRIKTFFSDLWYMRKTLLLNLVGVIGVTFLLVYGLMWFLNIYTLHGESIEVPDLKNYNIEDAKKLLETRDLEVVVNDSICKGKGLGGLIKDQTPKAFARVKESRKIYVNITRHSDCTASVYYQQMIGRPLSYVKKQLARNKLVLGSLKYLPGGKAENTVVEVHVEGQPLFVEADPSKGQKPPTEAKKVPHGSRVDLVLLEGIDAEPKYIHKLSCRRYGEAEFAIKGSQFVMGTVHYTGNILDTLDAWVWKQSPAPGNQATMGTGIDLWLISEKPQGCIDEELEAAREAARQDSIRKAQQNNGPPSTDG